LNYKKSLLHEYSCNSFLTYKRDVLSLHAACLQNSKIVVVLRVMFLNVMHKLEQHGARGASVKTTHSITMLLICSTCAHASQPQYDRGMSVPHKAVPVFSLKPFSDQTNYMSTVGYLRYLLRTSRTRKVSAPGLEGTVWTDGNLDVHFDQGGKTELVYRTFHVSHTEIPSGKTTLEVSEEKHVFMFTWKQEGSHVSISHKETLPDGTPRSVCEGLIEGDTIVGLQRTGPSTETLWSTYLYKGNPEQVTEGN